MAVAEEKVALEKRKHPRFNTDLPVKYSGTKAHFKYGKYGRVVNASEGGLLVHLPEETGVGQHLALQLFFGAHSELDIIETLVRVVWNSVHVRKDLGWDYRTGVRFTNISPEDLTKLKKFVMSFQEKQSCDS